MAGGGSFPSAPSLAAGRARLFLAEVPAIAGFPAWRFFRSFLRGGRRVVEFQTTPSATSCQTVLAVPATRQPVLLRAASRTHEAADAGRRSSIGRSRRAKGPTGGITQPRNRASGLDQEGSRAVNRKMRRRDVGSHWTRPVRRRLRECRTPAGRPRGPSWPGRARRRCCRAARWPWPAC